MVVKMGLGRTFRFGHNLARSTKNEGKKKMNAETSKAGETIWAFDLGKGRELRRQRRKPLN